MKWPWPISQYAAIPSLEWWVLLEAWSAYTIHIRTFTRISLEMWASHFFQTFPVI